MITRPQIDPSDAPRLIETATRHGSPLVDERGATFVRLGKDPPPPLVGEWADFRTQDALPMSELAPGVWLGRCELPANAYLEYAYLVDGERRPDPLNRFPASDGNGGRISRLWMPRAPREAMTLSRLPAGAVPRGRLARHALETGRLVAGHRRRLVLYRPAPATPPEDLLVVLDGQDYLVHQRLHRVVDALIDARRIRPIAIAFVYHGGSARFPEYSCSESTLNFLVDRVMPFARAELGLPVRPAAVLGPSLGGLMALYAALRRPDVFDRVVSQSGTFEIPDHEMVTGDLVRHLPTVPIHVRLSAGTFEWLANPVARMAALLRSRGYDVSHRPFVGGHNHRTWAEDALEAMEGLFRPPVAETSFR
jgi:enterochelin esterase-like enzyme